MKISGCIIIFLWISLSASAQNIAVTDSIIKFGITAKGKPDGEKAENKIGKDGGSITSSDGKIKLIFPEGALSKKTTISIQPTTNLAPNGNGKAYQMEPSGIIFNRPVQMIFSYSETETEGNSPILLGMAMQDEKGKWSSLKKAILDSISKTLTVKIHHFSAYVNFSLAKIYPSSARVKVNGSLRLSIRALEPLEEDGDDELAPLTNAPIEQILKWSVNAIDKGNSTVGLISASENTTAIYQAPAQVPAQNPVAVSVEQQFSASFLRRHQVSKLISNITVYDGDYEVKMISTMDGAAGSQLGAVKYSDNGSFIVSLKDNKAKITEIVNTNAAFTYNGKCTIVLLKPGQGNINILGVQNIRVISATSPSDNAWVEIFFVRSPTIFPILQFTCPDLKGGTFTTNSAMATGIGMSIPAFPQSIKFEAKEGEQTILKMGEEGGKIYAKFTVRQIKDD